jgi:sugar/nucleoside kinase (ribokinase family)
MIEDVRRLLVVGEALSTFMRYAFDRPLHFHGPFPSGAPVIFASAAARLGVGVDLAYGVGADIFGDMFRERLARDGVGDDLLVVDPVHPTSSAFVSYQADGSRNYVFYLESTASLFVPPRVLDRVADPAWVHLSGATLAFGGPTADTAWAAIARARRAKATISFDPNVRMVNLAPLAQERIDHVLSVADVIFASAGELEALNVDEATLIGRNAVVCYKAGAAGARVVTCTGSTTIAAPPAREVDPDGAGDIFAAGYVAAALNGHPPEVCAAVGCRVASASVEVQGPLESTIDRLAAYLEPGLQP